MEQRGTAKALAADALAALEVVIRGFEHGRGYLLKLESSDAMPELAQIGAQAGCGALLNLAGCNAGVDVVGGVLVERPRGPTHEVAMVELVMELAQCPLGLGPRAVEVLGLLVVFSSVWVAPEAYNETPLAALAAGLVLFELDDGAVAVTFRHAAHRPSAAGEGVHGAQ